VPFQNQFKMRHYSYRSVVVQFHDGADEILNHQGHEGSRRLLARLRVVAQFAKSLTTKATKVHEGNI